MFPIVHFARVRLIATAAVCMLSLSACGGSSEPTVSAPPTQTLVPTVPAIVPTPIPTVDAATLPTDEAGNSLVARVNGVGVLYSDYQRSLMRYAQQQFAISDSTIRSTVLNELINQTLINQAAVQQNVAISDEELIVELSAYIEAAGGESGWTTWLANNGYTDPEFRATLRDSLTVNRMRDQVTLIVTGSLPHVHARHILVADEALANELLTRIQAGEDFAALAAEYSIDTLTAPNGGDLGWFIREELIDPELAVVAFNLQPGEIAGPVHSALGYHIMQSLERGDRPIDEAKRPQLAQVFFDRWLTSLTESADIQVFLQL